MNAIEPVTLSLGATDRRDNWWLSPALIATALIAFVIYATYAGIANAHYEWGPYLSPFYSPNLKADWMPDWLSPAFLILAAPAGFRATCYYYRKSYYRSLFLDPPGCAVGEGKGKGYTGERAFPFVLQNLHRFFLYLAIVFVVILAYDAALAFRFPVDAAGAAVAHAKDAVGYRWGFGLGTIILWANVILLSGYTFGCHSLRHLIGGKKDCFSCEVAGGPNPPLSFKAWQKVTWLNVRHQEFAWFSLFSVAFTDVYIRYISMSGCGDLFTILF
jgi:hypothetical protein